MPENKMIDNYNERLIDYIKTITLSCMDSEFKSYLNYLEFIQEELDVAIEAEFRN